VVFRSCKLKVQHSGGVDLISSQELSRRVECGILRSILFPEIECGIFLLPLCPAPLRLAMTAMDGGAPLPFPSYGCGRAPCSYAPGVAALGRWFHSPSSAVVAAMAEGFDHVSPR
jgi:hypothetical protein